MEQNKLCRICGSYAGDLVHIFRTEGLQDKIETCLPIIVSQHSLLPDTICTECEDKLIKFYEFIKICLQNIIVLESQFNIKNSSLKTKRKHDKSTSTEPIHLPQSPPKIDLNYCRQRLNSFGNNITEAEEILTRKCCYKIVDYDSSSDESSFRNYFDDKENDLIKEIVERKSLKRKSDSIVCSQPKIFKLDSNRRKKRQPVKVQYQEQINLGEIEEVQQEKISLPQVCLLCDLQFEGPGGLASHVFQTHGIDMAQIVNNEPVLEKKKKIPNLVKITDLKRDSLDARVETEEPPTLEPSYVCPLCPATLTNRVDLFSHLRQRHIDKSHLICGLCLFIADSYVNLTDHLETCSLSHVITQRFICKICKYNDDNHKSIENHILVHDFLISFCKKESKTFDPADYIDLNPDSEITKSYSCTECGESFVNFRDFSTHRRAEHSIFHCDLCNKFYGRNSHLWKHVNRLHKGHPSITCQFCYKTSASKYHLAQHFNKIHMVKTQKLKNGDIEEEDFMNKKFEAFDFQSVRQSFMRQELEKEQQEQVVKIEEDLENVEIPKEIDSSSNLYTNIITNYTPPQNNGEFKCPKCSKGFHKKTLLKKHKKNCRPRLQKDLLTRCKSCSRIFKDRQSLAKHLVNYHSEYECEICNEKVQSKCEIVSHIRFNHPDCKLFCRDCGNVLRKTEDLITHLEDHSNSFVCQFCADLLPSKIKLKMHILSLHRKILSLSCGICLKLFESQHILRDHVRLIHKDVLTPLTSCTVCGKNYGSKWKTYDHLNKSHGRIFKSCKACLEVFDTEQDLELHYDAAHGNLPKEKNCKKEVVIKKETYESEAEQDKNEESYSEESPYETEEVTKISLLEKRLMAAPETTSPLPQTLPPPPPLQKKKTLKKLPKIEEYSDQNGTNSSKRTVYVNSNDPSNCEICLKTWPAKKHLWQHYIRCHKVVASTVCGICLKTNDSYEVLQNHLRENHPTLLHGQGFGSNFICRICGRYHNARSKLKLHMAIHENFDWKLLDNLDTKSSNEDTQDLEEDDDINYESLIEQVECSSENDSSSSSDSENESEIQDDLKIEESEEEEEDSSPSVVVKSENCSSEEEEEEEEEDEEEEEEYAGNLEFARDAEAVDSAVQSIVYEDDDDEYQEDSNQEYCEVQSHNLNPHEIQSAVDSIL